MLIRYANMAEYEELPDFSSASQSEIAFDSSLETLTYNIKFFKILDTTRMREFQSILPSRLLQASLTWQDLA